MGIEQALIDVNAEIASFNQGTSAQPKDGTTEWFRLRMHVLGRMYLQRIQQLGIAEDPAACERFYRECRKTFSLAEVPPAPAVERETLPT